MHSALPEMSSQYVSVGHSAAAHEPAPCEPASGSSQASWMHAPSGGVQIPQLALQHTCPAAQVFLPQALPALSGTHTASPFSTVQVVWSGQSARLQGFSAGFTFATHSATGLHGAWMHCT